MHFYAHNLFHSVPKPPYYLTTFTCTAIILFWTPENSQILKKFNFLRAFLVISPCNSLFVHNNDCMKSAPYNCIHLTSDMHSINSFPFPFISHNSKILRFPSCFPSVARVSLLSHCHQNISILISTDLQTLW